MNLDEVTAAAIDPALALLPARMDSAEARVMLLAIGLQESRFRDRRQLVGNPPTPTGPAKSFWQGERGGGMVAGVRTHAATRALAAELYAERGVVPNDAAIWSAIEHDDVLAAGLARLLLYSDPRPLPSVTDEAGAWSLYLRTWRPGKPHAATWPGPPVPGAAMSWGWLLNGRLWAGIAAAAVLAAYTWLIYDQGGSGARVELANLKASNAEQGRLAALARAKETDDRRREDAARQDQQDKEAQDGQERIEAAVAAAGRAGAAEQRVRDQFAAFRAAVRRSAEGAEAAVPGTPAAAAAGVHADLLGELGARTERLALLAGIYARTADWAHAAGITCQRSGDALSAPGVSLFSPE